MIVWSWLAEHAGVIFTTVSAGGIGGLVSTVAGSYLSDRAARGRQESDHQHARNLARANAEVNTAAAVRADRVELYLELMGVIAPVHDSLRMINLACLGSWAPGDPTRRTKWLEEQTGIFIEARQHLWSLLPRMMLLAGSEVRESYRLLLDLVTEELPSVSPAFCGDRWEDDVDGSQRSKFRNWWKRKGPDLRELSDRIHEAMRADVLDPPALRPVALYPDSRNATEGRGLES